MFELSKLGKLNTDTGLHDYTRYEIIGNEVIASIDTKVRPFDVLTGADKAALQDEFTFVVANRLGALDSVERLDVEMTLAQANLDGTRPYAR